MTLERLFALGRLASLAGIVLFASVAIIQLRQLAALNAEVDTILVLQAGVDRISAESDEIALNGADADRLEAFGRTIDDLHSGFPGTNGGDAGFVAGLEALQREIDGLAGPDGTVRAIDLGSAAQRATLSDIALLGQRLDLSLLEILVERKQAIAGGIWRSVLMLAAVGGSILGFFILYLFRVQGRVLPPVNAIIRAVDKAHDGDRSAGPVPGRGDELSELGWRVNEMVQGRVRIEEKLRSSLADVTVLNERLLRIQGIGRLGGWQLDWAAQKLTWDKQTLAIFELGETEFEGAMDHFLSLIHPGDRNLFDAITAEQLASARPFDITHRIVTASGTVKWVWERAEVLRDADGRIVALDGTVQDITELKQAELALQEARETASRTSALLRIAGRTAKFGGWRYVAGAKHIEWTDQTAEIHDEPPGTMPDVEAGVSYFELSERKRLKARMRSLLREGRPYDDIFRATTATGRGVWLRITGEPVHGHDGAITEARGALQDITDFINARTDADRRNAELEAIVSAIEDGFVAVDPAGRISFVNERARSLLGLDGKPLLARELAALDAAAAPGSPAALLACALRKGDARRLQVRDAVQDRWLEIAVHRIGRRQAAFIRDVTEAQRKQERLSLLEAAMEEIDDAVLITEAGSIEGPDQPAIVYANAALERMTGFAPSEVIGRTPRIFQGEGTRRSELDRIRAALLERRPVSAELVNYTAAGSPFWVQLDIFPIRGISGEGDHFVSIQTDVTEQKAREEREFRRANLESIGQLTGSVAHDFNNLLTVILGNAELLREGATRPAPKWQLDAMIEAAERGARLTDSLLAFARRTPLEPAPTDVNALLAESWALLRQAVRENIEIALSLSEGAPIADLDPARLQSAVVNLVLNARDAIEGHGRIEVATALVSVDGTDECRFQGLEKGDYISVSVSDDGSGMTPDILGRAFEPFFTTKPVGSGSGLGLSTVYGFATQSHGLARIDSCAGKGTTVELLLPVAAHDARAPIQPSGPPEPGRTGQGEHVLVVEDDAALQRLVEVRLDMLGYAVTTAGDAASALDLLRRADPPVDLLFTDIMLPGDTDGRALAEIAARVHPGLRVLFTSGHTGERQGVSGARPGEEAIFLRKPYRMADFARMIRQTLDR